MSHCCGLVVAFACSVGRGKGSRKTGSTPAVVPGAAPALAKAGVGGYCILSYCITMYNMIYLYTHKTSINCMYVYICMYIYIYIIIYIYIPFIYIYMEVLCIVLWVCLYHLVNCKCAHQGIFSVLVSKPRVVSRFRAFDRSACRQSGPKNQRALCFP